MPPNWWPTYASPYSTPTSRTPYKSARMADDSAMLPAHTRPPMLAVT